MKQNQFKQNKNSFNKQSHPLSEEECLSRLFAKEPLPFVQPESTINVRDRSESQEHLIKQINSLIRRRPEHANTIWWLTGNVAENLQNITKMWSDKGFSSTPVVGTAMFPFCETVFSGIYLPNAHEAVRHYENGTTDIFIQRKLSLSPKQRQTLLTRLHVLYYQLYCASYSNKISALLQMMLAHWRVARSIAPQGLLDFIPKLSAHFSRQFASGIVSQTIDSMKQQILILYQTVRDKVLEFFRNLTHYIKKWWYIAVVLISLILSAVAFVVFRKRPVLILSVTAILCGIFGAAGVVYFLNQNYGSKTMSDINKDDDKLKAYCEYMQFSPKEAAARTQENFSLTSGSLDKILEVDPGFAKFWKQRNMPVDESASESVSTDEEEIETLLVKKSKNIAIQEKQEHCVIGITDDSDSEECIDGILHETKSLTEHVYRQIVAKPFVSKVDVRPPVKPKPWFKPPPNSAAGVNLPVLPEDNNVSAQGDEEITPITMTCLSSLSHFMFGMNPKSVNNCMAPVKELNALFTTCRTVKDFVMAGLGYGYRLVDAVAEFASGQPFFTKSQELRVLTDLIKRQGEILARENIRADMVDDKDLCNTIVEAYETLLKYKRVAASPDIRSMGYANELVRLQTTYMPLYHEAQKILKLHKARIEPFWFYLFGAPGFGKTKFMEFFIPAVYNCLKTPAKYSLSQRYERKLDQEFWDSYANQWCTSVDDVFQVKDVEARTQTAMELIYMVNSNPYPLHMASIESKGLVSFESKFVITTTNEDQLPRNLGITDAQALYRRIGMRVELSTQDGQKFPVKTTPWTMADFAKWKFTVIYTDASACIELTFEELVNTVVTKLREKEVAAKQLDSAYSTIDYSVCMDATNAVDPAFVKKVSPQGMSVSTNRFAAAYYGDENEWLIKRPPYLARVAVRQQRKAWPMNPPQHSHQEKLYLSGHFEFCYEFYQFAQEHWDFVLENPNCIMQSIFLKANGVSPGTKLTQKQAEEMHTFCRNFTSYADVKPFFSEMWCATGEPGKRFTCDYGSNAELLATLYQKSPYEFMTTDQIMESLSVNEFQYLYKGMTHNSDFVKWFDSIDRKDQVRIRRACHAIDKGDFRHTRSPVTWLWQHWYKFFDWLTAPQGIRVTILGLVAGLLIALAIVLPWLVTPKQLGVDPQSRDNQETRDRTMTRALPFGRSRITVVKPDGARVEPQLSDQGATEIALRVVGNSYPCDIHYEDGRVFGCILLFLKGTIASTAAHCVQYNSPIRMVEIFRTSRDDRGSIEQYIPSEFSVTIMSEFDKAFFDFYKRSPMKDLSKHLPKRGDDLSGSGPGRVQFSRGNIVITKGICLERGITYETWYPTKDGQQSKDLIGSYRVRGCEGFSGDCGFGYVMFNNKIAKKIPGIHVASLGADSIIAPIYLEDLECIKRPGAHVSMSEVILPQGSFTLTPSIGCTVAGTQEVGTINQKIFMPRDSAIISSCFLDGVFSSTGEVIPCYYPMLKKPVWLHPFRNDKGELVKPLELALAKIADKRIRPAHPELFNRDNFLGIKHATFHHQTHKILTLEECVNGSAALDIDNMSLSKSSGPGFAERGIKLDTLIKRDPFYIDPRLEEQIKEQIALVSQGLIPPCIASYCLKDETRPIDRVAKGATRLFASMEKAHMIRSKMFLGTFKNALCSNPTESDIGLGIDCHCHAWGQLFKRLNKFGADTVFVGIDTPAWDVNFVVKFAGPVAEEIAHMMALDPKTHSDWIAQIRAIIVSTLTCYFLVGDKMFTVPLMPSGAWDTAWLNSIVNSACFRFAFRMMCPELQFDDWCALSVTGDDSALGLHRKIADRFNAITIAKFFGWHFNWKITNPDKSPLTIPYVSGSELVYLQRKFRVQGPYTFAPLEEASIYSMTQWIRSDEKPKKEQTVENLRTAIAEWFHHGKEKYEFERSRLNIIISCLIPSKVYTSSYDDLLAAYSQNQFNK